MLNLQQYQKLSILIKVIRKAILNDEWLPILIYGEKGKGKSTLALWIAYHIYGNWDTVLKYIVFTPLQFLEKIIECSNEFEDEYGRCPLIIWDDIGAYTVYDPKTYFSEEFTQLKKTWETIRSELAVLIGLSLIHI